MYIIIHNGYFVKKRITFDISSSIETQKETDGSILGKFACLLIPNNKETLIVNIIQETKT